MSDDRSISPGSQVRSARRALEILELVAEAPNSLTLSEIAGALKLPNSSAHALASTLLDADYLIRDRLSLRFSLGPKVGRLASAFRAGRDLASASSHPMDWLRDMTGETVSLTTLEGTDVVFIDKRTADGQVQVVNPVGTRLPAHATGSGKVMLACLPEERVKELYPTEELPQSTTRTIATRDELLEVLARVCASGYALDEQESEMGVWATAAAIRDVGGGPAGALSIFAPVFRVQAEHRRLWSDWVLEAAAEASAALGYLLDR